MSGQTEIVPFFAGEQCTYITTDGTCSATAANCAAARKAFMDGCINI